MKIDLLVFSPHPDDAEIFCGGLIKKLQSKGTAVIDFCKGELGSQGTVEIRSNEIKNASKALGLLLREDLSFPDGFSSINEQENWHLEIVKVIRRIKPKAIACPYWESRHPDHAAAGKLVQKAIFFSGLTKFHPELGQAYRPHLEMYYPMRVDAAASFICDVSDVYQQKLDAIECYSSQLQRSEAQTLISSPLTIHSIKARDSFFGAQIGVSYGEPYILRHAIKINDPIDYFDYLEKQPSLFYFR